MELEKDENRSKSGARELLLEDYRYLADSFWKHEQTGETRVNFLIGLVTVVAGALVGLYSKESLLLPKSWLPVFEFSILVLLLMGVVTWLRLLNRNDNADRCKRGLDAVRQLFKDHWDDENILLHYYPFGPSHKLVGVSEFRPRKFGGLVHTVVAINGLLFAALAGLTHYHFFLNKLAKLSPVSTVVVIGLGFVAAFVAQLAYVRRREADAKKKERADLPTHAGGVVYVVQNDEPLYLIVRDRKSGTEWVLPKGHIEDDEGHGEAALREVREETGIVACLTAFVAHVDYFTGSPVQAVRAKFYLMQQVYKTAASESRDTAWLPFEEAMVQLTHWESKYILRAAEAKRKKFCICESRS